MKGNPPQTVVLILEDKLPGRYVGGLAEMDITIMQKSIISPKKVCIMVALALLITVGVVSI